MKAVFLDRDGVINVDYGYVHKVENFELVEGIVDLLKFLKLNGYKLFIVTNQSGIGSGKYSKEDYETITTHMLKELANNGIEIESVFHCPHAKDADCDCRKPKLGMVKELLDEVPIDKENSFMIGDKDSDISFGNNLDVRTIRLISQYPNTVRANFEIESVHEVIDIIKEMSLSENGLDESDSSYVEDFTDYESDSKDTDADSRADFE